MFFLHAVADVALAKGLEGRFEFDRAIEQRDGGREHLHELASLLFEVGVEERAQRRIESEKALVEEARGGVGSRGHQGEAGADEADLFRCHGRGEAEVKF